MSCLRVTSTVRIRGGESGLVRFTAAGQRAGSACLPSPSFVAVFGSSSSCSGHWPRPAPSIGFMRISIRVRAEACRPAVRLVEEKLILGSVCQHSAHLVDFLQ